jgi:hypothetical protein
MLLYLIQPSNLEHLLIDLSLQESSEIADFRTLTPALSRQGRGRTGSCQCSSTMAADLILSLWDDKYLKIHVCREIIQCGIFLRN